MKLYATATSERASKGQGGNEYIEFDLFDSDKGHIGRFVFQENKETETPRYILSEDVSFRSPKLGVYAFQYESQIPRKETGQLPEDTKGEKQKGECNCWVQGKGFCPVHGNE